MNRKISLHPHSAIFVTMNPAGGSYRGRSKLPSNLKQLFRQVSMTYPDIEHIAHVLLTAEGFRKGKDLSKEGVEFFFRCKKTLSAEKHYDWGLRALKSIIDTAGKLLRAVNESPFFNFHSINLSCC